MKVWFDSSFNFLYGSLFRIDELGGSALSKTKQAPCVEAAPGLSMAAMHFVTLILDGY